MDDDDETLDEFIEPEDTEPFEPDLPEGFGAPEEFPEPFNFGTVEIAPGVFATITVEPGTIFDPAEIDFWPLSELLTSPFTEPERELFFDPLPPNFDRFDPDVRTFPTKESLANFLDESG